MRRQIRNLWQRGKLRQLHPECRWKVSVTDDLLEVVNERGERSSARFGDVRVITAQMAGNHLGTDWWVLDGSNGCILAYPWGAEGEGEAITFFQQQAGFDWDKLDQATRSVESASFVVWKRRLG